MAYRDDLEAALEHAQSLEAELARARAELRIDENKIAELERKLAEARKRAAPQEPKTPANDPRGADAKLLRATRWFLVVGILGIFIYGVSRSCQGAVP